MASKTKIEKFGPQDKSKIKGRVQHSRTGACTAKGKCYHGWIQQPRVKVKGQNKKGKGL
jgi:hypothetical protein